MILRKVRSISPGKMFDLLKKGPLQEFYIVIFNIVKRSFKLNQAGHAETESNQLWSMANDWE